MGNARAVHLNGPRTHANPCNSCIRPVLETDVVVVVNVRRGLFSISVRIPNENIILNRSQMQYLGGTLTRVPRVYPLVLQY